MDEIIFYQINNLAKRSPFLDKLGIFLAQYFEYFLILLLLIFLIKNRKKYFQIIIKGFLSALLARFGLVELIRFFWQRPRPFLLEKANLLLENFDFQKPAFPSGHAAFYFALSTIVYLYDKKTGIFFFFASLLICLARVFVGVHWPSDVLIGIFIGILVAKIVDLIFSKLSKSLR